MSLSAEELTKTQSSIETLPETGHQTSVNYQELTKTQSFIETLPETGHQNLGVSDSCRTDKEPELHRNLLEAEHQISMSLSAEGLTKTQ